ncbi:hypothetical protein E4G67_03205 [Candidatus Bathyarchaeota archaeon]|nr:MAG: hypothetical protein E4G67_03205 [Candidatus Bathyarchaeota archaeon]
MILTTALTTFAQDDVPEQFPPKPQLPPVDAAKAYVTVAAAVGGTTNPAPGSCEYPTSAPNDQATYFGITATPYQGYKFLYWVISGAYTPGHNQPAMIVPDPIPEDWVPKFPNAATVDSDSLVTSLNLLNVICGYGYNYTYQPVFTPTSPTTPTANTVVVLLQTLGGTSKVMAGSVSNNAPGTYNFVGGDGLKIQATADQGYSFSYWIVKGQVDGVFTDNPADISCQDGTTYTYQPVLPSSDGPSSDQGIPEMYVYIIIIMLVIVAIIGFGFALMYKSRSK